MKNKKIKILVGILFFFLSFAMLFFLSDKLFLSASSKETSIEVCEEGRIFPAAVRNFEMNLQYSDGAEMLKHYDVKGKGSNSNIFGYVQIWESEQSLSHYLKISKEYMSANVFGFYEGDLTINGVTWRKWDYIVNGVAVSQGFYEKEGKIYLCSLCVPYKEKTYSFDKIFVELLESVFT